MKFNLFDIDNWSEIFHTLSRNKTRTFLTGFGIFWGTAILALCFGGGRGFQGLMKRNFQNFSTNMGYVAPSRTTKSYLGYNKGRYWTLTTGDIQTIRRTIPEITKSSAICQTGATATYSTRSSSASVQGIEPDYWFVNPAKLISGRLLNESDDAAQRKNVVIGEKVANTLFGNEDAIGKQVSLNGIYFQVVGVASQLQEASISTRIDESVMVPLGVMKRAFNVGDNNGFFVYVTRNEVRPSDLEPRISRILKRNHAIAPDDDDAMYFGDISEMFEMVDKVFMGVDLLMLFVGIGTLLAGVIGVGNIMWIIVKERTREFGVRRAIGATPVDLTMQILSESMVLTTVAGMGGIVLSVAILGLIDHMNYDPWLGSPGFELGFGTSIAILVLFLVLGTAAGVIPALRAMRIKPIEALNDK